MTSHWMPLVLNANTFAVLWEKLGIGPLPRALFRLSPGSTRAERARIDHAAAVELSDLGIGAGRSIDHELTAALRLLAAPRIECYGWLVHCRTVSVLAVSRGRHAVLATVDERSIALSPAGPDALARAVAGELPPAPPAVASLPLPAYSRAAFEHTTGAAITGHGQLLAAARDKLGRRRRLGDVLEYVDTTRGRWLLRRDPAVAVPRQPREHRRRAAQDRLAGCARAMRKQGGIMAVSTGERQPLADDDPREVGPYRLVARIGSGGMGRVYLAHAAGGRELAVKIVRTEFADDAEFRQRFRQEVAAARRVHGAFTAEVVDADTEGERPWLATACVSGPSLHDVVTTHGPMPAHSVRLLACGLAAALRSIHAVGLVHRDLKPSNVLLAADGPRVIDFGIARAVDATSLTRTGVSIGSPRFMSPEQAAGRPVTAASDVFALGAVIVFAATGRAPFGDGAAPAVLYRVVHESPDLAGLPPELGAIASACLDKDPGARPALDDVVRLCGGSDPATVRMTEDWLPETVIRRVPAPTKLLAGVPVESQPRLESVTLEQPPRRPEHAPATEPVQGGVSGRSRRRRTLVALGVAIVECAAVVVMAKVLPTEVGLVATLAGHVHGVNSVAFSPDGRTVASGSDDGTVRLWNVTNPREATLLGQPLNLGAGSGALNWVESVAFSPDGRMLAGAGGVVRLWRVSEPARPTVLGRLQPDNEGLSYLAFSPNGRVVATGGSAVRLWTGADGPVTAAHEPLPPPDPDGKTVDYSVAFSPDGRTIAVRGTTTATDGDENPIQLWNVSDPDHPTALGQVQAGRRTPFRLNSLAFSRDGKVLAAGNYDGTVQLWDVSDPARTKAFGPPVGAASTGGAHIVNSVALSPNGNVLAVGDNDGTVQLWNIADPVHPTETGQPLAHATTWRERLLYRTDVVRSVTFSPDGRVLAVGAGNTVQLWDCRLAGCLGT